MRRISLFTTIISLLLLIACNAPNETIVERVSIAHLKSLCSGDHYHIGRDLAFEGVVVDTSWSDDRFDNIIVVDESGGVEVMISLNDNKNALPIYSRVRILCNDLTLARIGGKIALGVASSDDYPLEEIGAEMLGRKIRIVGYCDNLSPATKQLSDIHTRDISNIFRFESLRICDEEQGLGWCDIVEGKPVTTYRTFINSKGETIAIRISESSHYAFERIPANEISVIGVLDYSDNRYFIRLVNRGVI